MGINRIKGIALGLSLSALMFGQAAQAQADAKACVQEADLADAVVYAVPILTKAMRGKCGATLARRRATAPACGRGCGRHSG